jgi:hypothetical protein
MALTNAEKQRRWKERNQVALTWDAEDIAEKLMDMEDQAKLGKIVRYLKDHLKHPDRNWKERAIALGKMGIDTLNGPLTKREALEYVRKPPSPPQGHSWLVEATTKDSKRWRNGVRLSTKEEAEAYVEFARFDLEKEGYLTGWVIHCEGEKPNCSISRRRKGGRPTFLFPDGGCAWLGWSVINAGERNRSGEAHRRGAAGRAPGGRAGRA